ncbi:adenosylcobinamide-GDP ribazoletransferase [Cyanobium sp. ATX 6A2]|nr:adenosylcobinamide-GDP ribazoletransferase [Cyanobium sp. ATX 6A2]
MKQGVSTAPWGVWKRPQRARLPLLRAVIAKLKGLPLAESPGDLPPPGETLMGPHRSCDDATRQPFRAPGWLRDLAGAWVFYSVLPAWPGIAPRFQRIARFAPLIGVVLGGLQALLWLHSEVWLPAGGRVALVIALALVLSGGLHHDGALDTADGLAAGPRALEAMQDSRVGAAAVQAALLLVLLRAAGLFCLAPLAASLGAIALVWAGFWGRVAPLLAMHRYPYLRQGPSAGGTAAFHRRHWAGLGPELLPALLVGVPLLAASAGFSAAAGHPLPASGLFVLAGAGLPPALLLPWWLGRRLGGHSGDSYGACVEWSETLALLLSGLLWSGLSLPAAG